MIRLQHGFLVVTLHAHQRVVYSINVSVYETIWIIHLGLQLVFKFVQFGNKLLELLVVLIVFLLSHDLLELRNALIHLFFQIFDFDSAFVIDFQSRNFLPLSFFLKFFYETLVFRLGIWFGLFG